MLIARDDVAARAERAKAVQILAKSIFKELRTQGYETKEIVALSTELLGLVTNELRPEKP
jgi:hypothetical protein